MSDLIREIADILEADAADAADDKPDALHALAAILHCLAEGDTATADAILEAATSGELPALQESAKWEEDKHPRAKDGKFGRGAGGGKGKGKESKDRKEKKENPSSKKENPSKSEQVQQKKERVSDTLKRRKAEAEPKREEARQAIHSAIASPNKIRVEHLHGLTGHLKTLTRDEIRTIAKQLGQKTGAKLKDHLVQGIIDHFSTALDANSPGKFKGTSVDVAGTIPKRISERWISQKSTVLQHTAKTLGDGAPNPAYSDLKAEVSEATAELARWKKFEGWVKADLGMTLNSYPLRTKSQTYEPGQVFLKKDKASGQTTVMTKNEAWEMYAESLAIRESMDHKIKDMDMSKRLEAIDTLLANEIQEGMGIPPRVRRAAKWLLETPDLAPKPSTVKSNPAHGASLEPHKKAFRDHLGDEYADQFGDEFDQHVKAFDALPEAHKARKSRAHGSELGAKITYAGKRVGLTNAEIRGVTDKIHAPTIKPKRFNESTSLAGAIDALLEGEGRELRKVKGTAGLARTHGMLSSPGAGIKDIASAHHELSKLTDGRKKRSQTKDMYTRTPQVSQVRRHLEKAIEYHASGNEHGMRLHHEAAIKHLGELRSKSGGRPVMHSPTRAKKLEPKQYREMPAPSKSKVDTERQGKISALKKKERSGEIPQGSAAAVRSAGRKDRALNKSWLRDTSKSPGSFPGGAVASRFGLGDQGDVGHPTERHRDISAARSAIATSRSPKKYRESLSDAIDAILDGTPLLERRQSR